MDIKKLISVGIMTILLIIYYICNMYATQQVKLGGAQTTRPQPVQYYNDIRYLAKYSSQHPCNQSTHNGQVKLILGEIEFLTQYSNLNGQTIVIYVGSAPSNKMSYLSELFPTVKFVMVDPSEHYVKWGKKDQYDENYRNKFLYFRSASHTNTTPGANMRRERSPDGLINTLSGLVHRGAERSGDIPEDICEIIKDTPYNFYVIEDMFTNELATKLVGLNPCLFITDARTAEEDCVQDIDILHDSAMVYNWLEILKPVKFMLKFRLPWPITNKSRAEVTSMMTARNAAMINSCKIPLLENYHSGRFEYIRAEKIYMQAYAGSHSAETRLIGSKLETVDYPIKEYEQKLAYYNQNVRCRNMGGKTHDYALAIAILQQYRRVFNTRDTPGTMWKKILSVIERRINISFDARKQ